MKYSEKEPRLVYRLGLIPSQALDEYEYQFYLKFASTFELENDLITQETLDKMGDVVSSNIQNRIMSTAWNNYLRYR
jgi:hypothetical protein